MRSCIGWRKCRRCSCCPHEARAARRPYRNGYARAGGEKTLHVYDGFFHEVFNDPERGRVFQDLAAWLATQLPKA